MTFCLGFRDNNNNKNNNQKIRKILFSFLSEFNKEYCELERTFRFFFFLSYTKKFLYLLATFYIFLLMGAIWGRLGGSPLKEGLRKQFRKFLKS